MEERKRVLITGANGFVGQAVATKFLAEEAFEVLLCGGRKAPGEFSPKNFFHLDLTDKNALAGVRAVGKIEALVHCAGLTPQSANAKAEDFWRINVRGTENASQLAGDLGAEHFVLISSVSVYGNYGRVEVDETFSCRPVGEYPQSKLEAEKVSVLACREKNIPLTILRLGTVIGEGDGGNVARLITIMDKGLFFFVGSGKNKKSLIYKKDVAEAVFTLVKKKARRTEVFNLTAEAVEMREIVERVAESLNRKRPGKTIPAKFLAAAFQLNKSIFGLKKIEGISKNLEKWLADEIYSGQKLTETYNFKPRTTVAEAIDREVKHFLALKKKK
jgi:nucleoside-diphosphate-sugar epimerase